VTATSSSVAIAPPWTTSATVTLPSSKGSLSWARSADRSTTSRPVRRAKGEVATKARMNSAAGGWWGATRQARAALRTFLGGMTTMCQVRLSSRSV
jgi:hypothetical protein